LLLFDCPFCRELSGLHNGTENKTSSFSEVKRCICVQGAYPEKLIDLWNDYNNDKGKLQVTYLMCLKQNCLSSHDFLSKVTNYLIFGGILLILFLNIRAPSCMKFVL
jgi:hypothetical protein